MRQLPNVGDQVIGTPDNGEPPFVVGTYFRCERVRAGGCIMRSPFCLDCLESGDVEPLFGKLSESTDQEGS